MGVGSSAPLLRKGAVGSIESSTDEEVGESIIAAKQG